MIAKNHTHTHSTHDLQTGLLRGRGVHLVGKLAFGMAAVVALGKRAHSQSIALCERLKQYLHCSAFAWPVKAMSDKVGSIFAHLVSGEAAALWRKRRSYSSQVSPSYSLQASTMIDRYPSRSSVHSGDLAV